MSPSSPFPTSHLPPPFSSPPTPLRCSLGGQSVPASELSEPRLQQGSETSSGRHLPAAPLPYGLAQLGLLTAQVAGDYVWGRM